MKIRNPSRLSVLFCAALAMLWLAGLANSAGAQSLSTAASAQPNVNRRVLRSPALDNVPGTWDVDPAADWTFQGRVYEGDQGQEPAQGATPLQGVVVSVYGANDAFPITGTLIRSTTTDSTGWYGLTVYDDDGNWEFYHIRETNPPGYLSTGATSVGGSPQTLDWIQYAVPLTGKTLTGNKFWDRLPTPTATHTLPPTPSSTPTSPGPPTLTHTPTDTPTPLPTWTPTSTATGVVSPPPPTPTFTPTDTATPSPTATGDVSPPPPTPTFTPTDTATPSLTATGDVSPPPPTRTWTPTGTASITPSPTGVAPPDCPELLTNGDFERDAFAGWEHGDWVSIAWGHESGHGAHLGGENGIAAELWQTVAITAEVDSVHLGFWWLYEGEGEQPGDALTVIVQTDAGATPLLTLSATGPAGVWRYHALSMTPYAGRVVHLTFLAQTDGESPSIFVLDDITLRACGGPGEATATPTASLTPSATALPTGTSSATPTLTATPTLAGPLPSDCLDFLGNGGFEEGELASWEWAGAVAPGPGREDERGAWLGGANDAHGELLQSVYIPPEGSSLRLAFWWMPESAEEQAGDALSVIIQHRGGADQLLELHADSRRLWREEVLDLGAYAGQIVTLTFLVRTDGEAPSGFLLDDVAVLACGEAAYPEATWQFSGQVLAMGGEEPVRGAQVGLYGALETGAPGELLASAQTGRDGEFSLVIRDYQEEGFPYYFVGLDDPNHVAVAAEAGLGGAVVGEHRIRFVQPSPREYGSNRLFVERGTAEFTPIQPAIVPAWQPMATYWYDMPPDIDLYIKAIEVTQGIQCLDQSEGYTQCPDNSLELTNGKTTAIRVYVGCNNCPSMVTKLHSLQVDLLWAGSKLSLGPGSAVLGGQSAKQTSDVELTTKLSTSRDKGYDVTFVLPNTTGMCLSLIATVNGDQKYQEADFTNNDYSLNVPLYNRKPLKISYMQVEYRADGYTGDVWADAKSVGAASSLAAQIYPIPIQYGKLASWLVYGPHPITGAKCAYCPQVQTDNGAELLKKIGQVYNSGWLVPKPDVLVGWVPWSASGYTEPTWSTNWKWAWAHDPDAIAFAHLIGHLKPMGNLTQQPCAPGYTIGEVGFDALKKAIVSSSTADIMYWKAGSMWISPYMWNRMLGKTYTKGWSKCGSSPAASGLDAHGDVSTRRTMPARLAQETLPAILVSGRLAADGGGELDPLYQYASQGPFAGSEPEADYCVEFQNASGEPLAGHCFVPPFIDPEGGASRETVPFSFLLPLPEEAQRVLLRHGEHVLAERVASAHAPSISVAVPETGPVITGTTVISWAGDDQDGDALQYAVLYSADGGASWSPMAFDIEGTALQVESAGWAGGEDARLRVLASDGFHTAMADSAPFGVMRKPPRVSIGTPGEGAVIPLNGALALQGHAEDLEDGLLGGEALTWWSDRQGRLGTGDSWMLPPGALDPGWHEISLRAMDSDGMEGSAYARVFVGIPIQMPLLLKG